MEANEKKDREIERDELARLIGEGFRFTVTYNEVRRFLWIRKVKAVKEEFVMKEPTLATLDRLSRIWVDMEIDDSRFKGDNDEILAYAKQLASKYGRRMAEVVAVAVVGEDYQTKGEKEVRRLTDVFMKTLKPSQLITMANAITSVSNLADFIASMRLTSASRTTQKIADRVE